MISAGRLSREEAIVVRSCTVGQLCCCSESGDGTEDNDDDLNKPTILSMMKGF